MSIIIYSVTIRYFLTFLSVVEQGGQSGITMDYHLLLKVHGLENIKHIVVGALYHTTETKT